MNNVIQVQFYDLIGLDSFQLVTITIAATNKAGTSEISNEVSARTSEGGMIIATVQ